MPRGILILFILLSASDFLGIGFLFFLVFIYQFIQGCVKLFDVLNVSFGYNFSQRADDKISACFPDVIAVADNAASIVDGDEVGITEFGKGQANLA